MRERVVLLASTSARRKDLLGRLGIPFAVADPGLDDAAVDPELMTRAAWVARDHLFNTTCAGAWYDPASIDWAWDEAGAYSFTYE